MLCTPDDDLPVKRSEALAQAATWMNAENTTLSERSQKPRPRGVWFHLREPSRVGSSTETKIRGGQGLGEAESASDR